MRPLTVVLFAFLAVVVGPAGVSGQRFPDTNGQALAGVTEFYVQFSVSLWGSDRDRARENFERNGQSAFELALRRDGVRVVDASANDLRCRIAAWEIPGGWVYDWDLDYWHYNYSPTGVHLLMWEDGGMSINSTDDFSASDIAQQCADAFVNEWLRWNPR